MDKGRKRPTSRTGGTKKPLADSVLRAQLIAEKSKPNMKVVEVAALSNDSSFLGSDQSGPELEVVKKKYGLKNNSKPGGKELHMVVMEPKVDSADEKARQRKVVIVDDEKVVGEQG